MPGGTVSFIVLRNGNHETQTSQYYLETELKRKAEIMAKLMSYMWNKGKLAIEQ